MAHFGIVSPPVAGHINPFTALGRELIGRGHRVTLLHMADVRTMANSPDLGFIPLGQTDHPAGTLSGSLRQLGRLTGNAAIRFTIRAVAKTTEMFFRDAPAAIAAAGIDSLLVDQMEPAGGTIAEHLGLPFFTVCNALAINQEPDIPPPFTPWNYRPDLAGRLRNRLGYLIGNRTLSPVTRIVAEYRRRWQLPPHLSPDDSFSSLAQICQMPRAFDFPRRLLPNTFHYTGPLRGEESIDRFPWESLDGRPVIYASLGTLQNQRPGIFREIAEACISEDHQVVISHGGGLTEAQTREMPGRPLVVPYAPQRALLARGALTVTHAGLNTVLDSLSCGVPLVAIPITYEQPAIARRIERSGTGRIVEFATLGRSLRTAVRDVLENTSYRAKAGEVAAEIRAAGGVRRAADLIGERLRGANV